jgi:hypothetical protein
LSDGISGNVLTTARWQGRNDEIAEGVHTVASAISLKRKSMNTIIYIVGLVVIIGVILSYFGMR